MFLLRSAAGRISKINLLIEPISAFDKALCAQRGGFLAAVAGGGGINCQETFKVQNIRNQQLRRFSSLQTKHLLPMNSFQKRNICTHEITKNLTLFSDKPRNVDKDPKTLRLKTPVDNPLVVIFSWMLAKKNHLAKYAKIYIDLGFDALTVEISPWQLLWPLKGSQIIAKDVATFLENNAEYKPIVIHGFSVGGYVCGEVLVHMARDLPRYQPIINKCVAQIWDSGADITEIPVGFPKAMFPNNPTLEKALRSYTKYHMRTFHDQATVHYMRSSQMFHSTPIKAPVLMFVSKSDPIGSERSNWLLKEDYERSGMKVTWKCWDRSPHVLHYQKHPEEYMEYLLKHLQENVMAKLPQKLQAKL